MVSSLRRIDPSPPRRIGWVLKDGNTFCGKVTSRDNRMNSENIADIDHIGMCST